MYQPKQYVPLSGYARIIVGEDSKPVIKPGPVVLVARLNEPGQPIQRTDGSVVVKLGNGQQRGMISGQEEVLNLPGNILAYDGQGVVHGTYETKARINVAFSYAQSVEMIKELIDGTAHQKQQSREQAWEQRAAKLGILR
ncbi:MAG: hypothetical protein AAGL66_03705 [Pseudomonadota bacterium]